MSTYYLAIDIGASSGRHILGWIEDGKIQLEEVYRFPNGNVKKNGHRCWDHESLCENIVQGMKRCAEIGKIPSYLGIDTWGVDFLLLDEQGAVVGDRGSWIILSTAAAGSSPAAPLASSAR